MSETNIIPVDLKRLVCWRVCQGDQQSIQGLVDRFVSAARTPRNLTPLDLNDLRKTQRRVATLLGQSAESKSLKKKWRHENPPTLCYVCRKKNPYSESFDKESLEEEDANIFKGKKGQSVRFAADCCLFENDVAKEPGLTLPPVFRSGDKRGTLMVNDVQACASLSLQKTPRAITPPLSLPTIHHKASPVSNKGILQESRDTQGFETKHTGNMIRSSRREFHSYPAEASSLDPNFPQQRSHTLESERTWGSLHNDEDYVPMSVSVRKVASLDLAKSGSSLYQEYSDFFTSSSSGSADQSREATFLSECTYSSFLSSSSKTYGHPSGSWCKCPGEPSRLLSQNGETGPCLECKVTNRNHEGWCLSMGSVCLHCRRPIVRSKSRSGQSVAQSSTYTDRDLSADLLTAVKLHNRKTTKDVIKNSFGSGNSGQSNSEKSLPIENTETYRVRFAETVEKVSPDNKNILPKFALINIENSHKSDDGYANHSRKDAATKRAERKKNSSLLPAINKNIHRDAYILALKDAHSGVSRKKTKKQKKQQNNQDVASSGIIFSYFPLLKRPALEIGQNKAVNLGLRQDHGKSITLKKTMKHIFGKIKLGDYYPGGKKYPTTYQT
ncbi:hypothetical protein PoB_001194700 [Plakobranchus ocellatus]|uniref:GATA-type domain-containing protein n=1 Tax=Plakobranchus ocellatus TaxID=259542 RepID=A0AAV3YR85_9GAST|nr:hypothetical protein PoB_001194700 [Plakobranchus ocellatus]